MSFQKQKVRLVGQFIFEKSKGFTTIELLHKDEQKPQHVKSLSD